MAQLTAEQVAAVVLKAGFTGTNAVIAVAVSRAESGWRTDAVNKANANGSTDYGLFQINTVHSDLLKRYNWQDPLQNAQMAKIVFDNAGGRWTPWTVYKTGRYTAYLGEAQRAVARANGGNIPLPDVSTTPVGVVGDTESISKLFKLFSDPDAWARASWIVLGTIFLLLGLFAIGLPLPTKTLGKYAKKVIKK